MKDNLAVRIAAFFGFLAVVLGAFGAHALKGILEQNQTSGIWEKAVFYHFVHTIMMFVIALYWPRFRGPWFAFLCGIVIFSGSLYLLALTNVRWLGAITPFGGGSFIIGWLWLAICPKCEKARSS